MGKRRITLILERERMSNMKRYALYVDGHWVEHGSSVLDVHNPATGDVVGSVPTASRAMVRNAIDAAYRALASWSSMPAGQRAELLTRVATRIRNDVDRLARVLTMEQGKPLAEARGEMNISADYFQWNAEEAKRVYGEIIPASVSDKRLLAIRQPVGVAASITPWNFPASMIARKVAPALAVGCPVVIKPASTTPLSALELVRICDEVGIPQGVINVIVGNASEIADEFVSNPKVRKISFTGSTEVGQNLMRAAATDLKRISLELGGHAPFVVLDDADLDQAVQGVVASKYRNAGQTCICANRLYVQRPVYEEFGRRLAQAVGSLKVGNGIEPHADVGPLIDESALLKVERQVADAVKRGGRVMVGGERPDLSTTGSFYLPTVITDLPHDALLAQEETFGPLLGMWPFDTDDEGVQLANNTPYGLAAYFYGRDLGRITRMYEALEYGIVGVNDPVPTVVQAPFGGVKHSGFGREGGHQGLDEYLDWKFVSIHL